MKTIATRCDRCFTQGLALALLMLAVLPLRAQEILRPLRYNNQLQEEASKPVSQLRSSNLPPDTICLPFLDDFANPDYRLQDFNPACGDTACRTNADIFPTDLLWMPGSGAFVNATYPIDPPTYGVATLDGLKANGRPYSETSTYGPADTLMSRPIRLGGPITDSVFLSFWYQPAGLGDNPESQDSLLLEFRSPDSTWQRVWFTVDETGTVADSFQIVMVPLDNSAWYYDGFQFRFRNLATRTGNNDHWHIDYVFLDDNRSRDDTLFRDVSFAEPPSSMLRNYRQMPWRQFRDFQSSELAPDMQARVRNIFNIGNNTNFQDTLLETFTGSLINSTTSESAAIPALGTRTFVHDNFEIPNTAPNFDEDSFSVTWQLRLNPSDDINPWNDTVRVRQDFYNWYAYDDGTAERAYGLIGLGARFAMEFETNQPDSIYAVYIHWAFVDENNSNKFFSLLVYDFIDTAATGAEDVLLYQEDFLTPRYVDSVNGFWIYNLEEPIPVDGKFYIGWLQSQNDILDVGFDRNTDASDNTFFNLGDIWNTSSLPGAVMMRPQMGPNYRVLPPTGIDEPVSVQELGIQLYPNPAANLLHVQVEGLSSGMKQFQVFDMTGRTLQSGQFNASVHSLNVSGLDSGIYLLELRDELGRGAVRRFAVR